MQTSNRGKCSNRGFTLIELVVGIAIVGLILGVVIVQPGDPFNAHIKSATNKVSNTIRYLHDKAATENLYIRLVFDFDKNSYWVEATTERFLLSTKETLDAEQKELEEEKKEKESESGKPKDSEETVTDPLTGEEKTVVYLDKYRTPVFGAVDEFLLKPVVLPDGVYLKDIYTKHDEGPVEGGQAFIYFFPNGYVEPAIINLRNEEDDVNYSIEIQPATGKTILSDQHKGFEDGK